MRRVGWVTLRHRLLPGGHTSCGNVPGLRRLSGSRAASDVCAVADPYTGVAVYDSSAPATGFPPGFIVVGGASASSPFLAGAAVRGDVPKTLVGPNLLHAAKPATFIDVTVGSNAPPHGCESALFDTRLCVAGRGWDGPTGLGVPSGKHSIS